MSVSKIHGVSFSSSMQAFPSAASVVQKKRIEVFQNAEKVKSIVSFCYKCDFLKENDSIFVTEFDLLSPLNKLKVLSCIANKPLFPFFFGKLPLEMIKKYVEISSSTFVEDKNRYSYQPVSASSMSLRVATIANYIKELNPSASTSSSTTQRVDFHKPTFKEERPQYLKRNPDKMKKVLDHCQVYAPWKLQNPDSLPVKYFVATFNELEPFEKIELLIKISSGCFIHFFYDKLPISMKDRLQEIITSVNKKYPNEEDSDKLVQIAMKQYRRELMYNSKSA